MKPWYVEWIPYMNAYRVYDPTKPQDTIAYVDDISDARDQAIAYGARVYEVA